MVQKLLIMKNFKMVTIEHQTKQGALRSLGPCRLPGLHTREAGRQCSPDGRPWQEQGLLTGLDRNVSI